MKKKLARFLEARWVLLFLIVAMSVSATMDIAVSLMAPTVPLTRSEQANRQRAITRLVSKQSSCERALATPLSTGDRRLVELEREVAQNIHEALAECDYGLYRWGEMGRSASITRSNRRP